MNASLFRSSNEDSLTESSTMHLAGSAEEQPLSIAVVSPDPGCRHAAVEALDRFSKCRIREFISFPHDIEEVAQVLKMGYDVVIVDLDSDVQYALSLIEHICVESATNVITFSVNADPDVLLR